MTDRVCNCILFFVCFLVVGHFCLNHHNVYLNDEPVYHQYAVESTQELPTTSCTIIGRTQSNTKCSLHCKMVSNIRFLFSRDSGTGSCACCYLPLSGSVLHGSEWNSFLQSTSCPSNFEQYKLDDLTVCLGYSKSFMTYDDATSYCQKEGGDLIKIYSHDKFNILKDFINVTADLTTDQVWIQGEEINGVWWFHDGTTFTNPFCPPSQTNTTGENHMRFATSYGFTCHDMPDSQSNFVCEVSFNDI